jgi:hypothetical protein
MRDAVLDALRERRFQPVVRIDFAPGAALDIRRQLTEGTYEIEDRLDGAIGGVLEAITCPSEKPCLDGDVRSRPAKLVAC